MTENSSAKDLAATQAAEREEDDDESAPIPGLALSGDPGLADRYGIRHGMSRTRKIMLGVFGFVVLCGVAGYIAWNEANPQIQASVVTYTVSGSSITVTFEVDKKASQAVECTIQAEDLQGDVIGSVNVAVPSGRADEDEVYTVNTTGTPNTAEVSACDVTS
jgi:hypothetical protein